MKEGKLSSRLMALLLSVMMLVAYMPMLNLTAYAESTLKTNKDVYTLDEPIMVTSTSDISGYTWAGLYQKDATPVSGNSYYWNDSFSYGVAFDIKSEHNDTPLTTGDYKVVFFGDGGFGNIVATKNITIKSNEPLSTDKTEYTYGEAIMVTATSENSNAWVGLYKKNDATDGNDVSFYWYYV